MADQPRERPRPGQKVRLEGVIDRLSVGRDSVEVLSHSGAVQWFYIRDIEVLPDPREQIVADAIKPFLAWGVNQSHATHAVLAALDAEGEQ